MTKQTSDVVASAVASLLIRDSRVPFVFLQPKRKPVRPERFKGLHATVHSATCDVYILFDKILTVIRSQRKDKAVAIAKTVQLKRIGTAGPKQWQLAVDGWWV